MPKPRNRFGPLLVVALAIAGPTLAHAGQGVRTGADVVRGAHIATALAGCTDCHAANLAGGREFRRAGSSVYASNLTGGAGGLAAQSDADIQRAIRGGVAPDGAALRVMPWREYAIMTDRDVADLIAYLRSLPPVDHVVSRARPAAEPPGGVPTASATDAPALAPAPALTGGAYLAVIGGCTNCHGVRLSGAVRPDGSVTPNITHDGIGGWSFADFQTAMRTGRTPAGRTLATVMPWQVVGKMTDPELRSVYDYLQAQRAPER